MSLWLLVISCSVGVAGWLLWSRNRVMLQPKPADERSAGTYRCVSIRPHSNACASARQLEDQRFLPRDAPRFPLGTCDAAACRCRYVHFKDRRDDERRHSHALQRGLNRGPGTLEHRSGGERRRSSEFAPHVLQ